MLRSLAIGGLIAVVLIALVVAGLATGLIPNPSESKAPAKLLVIATTPDSDGVQVAKFAFVLERGSEAAILLDTSRSVTIAGTTVNNPSEALPFVGASGVADALSPQTGGEKLPWILLPPAAWEQLVDKAGGVKILVPEGVSAYREGKLVILEPGQKTLSGAETAALASWLDYSTDVSATQATFDALSASLSTVVTLQSSRLPSLVRQGYAESSLETDVLQQFASE